VWNDPPRHVSDWYRFVRALATAMRRHRNIRSYEIYNEENVRNGGMAARPRTSISCAAVLPP